MNSADKKVQALAQEEVLSPVYTYKYVYTYW